MMILSVALYWCATWYLWQGASYSVLYTHTNTHAMMKSWRMRWVGCI